MMNTLSDCISSSEERHAGSGSGNPRIFYLELARRTCPAPENPESETAWLWKLYTDSRKMLRLLTLLDTYTASDNLTPVQHACSYYLIRNNESLQERLRTIDTLTAWSSLSMNLSELRPSVVRLKEEYIRRLRELKILLNTNEGA